MSKLTKILLIVGVFDLAFIVCMVWVYIVTGAEMTTLTTCVLGASGVETVVTAAIKVANIKHDKPITAGDITGFDDAEVVDHGKKEQEVAG